MGWNSQRWIFPILKYGCRDVCQYYKRSDEENIPDYPGQLIIDMTGVEGDVERELVLQGVISRAVVDVVHRLVNARVGIEVVAELHSDAFAILYHAVAGEVLRAVEAHVFKEVGKASLVLLLEYGTHALGNVEIGLSLRFGIVAYVVRHPVV